MALAWFFTLGQPERAKVARVDQDFLAIGNALKAYKIETRLRAAAVQEDEEKMESRPSY
jgi:hypothetical protein